MKRKPIFILLVVLGATCGGLAGFKYWDQRQRDAETMRVAQAIYDEQQRHRAEEKARSIDSTRLMEDYKARLPEADARRAVLLKQIAQTKSELIVFPPSAPMYRPNLDLTARIAIARQLAQMIEAETGVPVPDPAVVFEAYGAPRRTVPDLVPTRLLDSKVRWFITGYASHDGHGKMTIKLVKVPFKVERPPILPQFERSDIAISEELPPEAAFEPMAGEALRALGFKGAAIARVRVDAPSQLPLPPSPAGSDAGGQSPIEGLWMQHLIGVLHHSSNGLDPRPRERVFERTLAGLQSVAPESGDYRILKARSLIYTGRPLAALELFKAAAPTAEERALLSYVNGDLPAMKASVLQIERQIPRMIAECELLILRAHQADLSQDEQRHEAQRLASQAPKDWQPLFALHAAHQSLWTLPSPAQLKPLLDHAFAIEGYGVHDLVQGKAALGEAPYDDQMAVELMVSPLVHVSKWRAANAQALCCEQGTSGWVRFERTQYLDLLDALAAGEIAGHLDFLTHAQGRPEEALRLGELVDQAYFHGADTQILAARIEALQEFSYHDRERARGMQADEQMLELAKKVLSWDSAQSYATADAFASDAHTNHRGFVPPRMQGKLAPGVDASLFDSPQRPVWALRASYAALDPKIVMALRRNACRLSVGDITPCLRYLEKAKEQIDDQTYRKEIATLIEPRFDGNGPRAVLLSQVKLHDGDIAGAEALLKESMTGSARQMDLFSALGGLQMRQGRYAEAAKTYLAYPELKDSAPNTVGLSNYLYSPAFEFLERGAVPEARQLFSIVARYQDGSYANLAGAIHLAFMDGRYELARDILQDQYRRYHNGKSARKLISLQFMMGNSEQAWSALKQETRIDRRRPSLVGLRMADADPARIVQWSAEDANTVQHYMEPIAVMFQAMTIDRPAASIRALYEMDVQARGAITAFKVPVPTLMEIKTTGASPAFMPHPGFLDGYAAFKDKSYEQSMTALKPIYDSSAGSGPERQGSGFLSFLPYYAFAAAKTGNGDAASAVDQRLSAPAPQQGNASMRKPQLPDFEHHLTLAIANAFNNHHVEAMNEAQKARAALGSEDLFESGYVFLEILERLSEETRQPGYLALAVDYAHAYQALEPWTSWAYAFEARHAANAAVRVRAAGIALKLDPQSHWLRGLDKQTLAQARQWLANHRWPGKDAPNVSARWNRT